MIHEIDYLLAPPSPVMGHVVTPVVNPSRDVLLAQQGIHLSGTFQEIILPGSLPHAHHNAAVPVDIPIMMVGGHRAQKVVG